MYTYRFRRPNKLTPVDFHFCNTVDEAKNRFQWQFGTWPDHEPELVGESSEKPVEVQFTDHEILLIRLLVLEVLETRTLMMTKKDRESLQEIISKTEYINR